MNDDLVQCHFCVSTEVISYLLLSNTKSFDDGSYSGAIPKLPLQSSIKFVKNIRLRPNLLNLLKTTNRTSKFPFQFRDSAKQPNI